MAAKSNVKCEKKKRVRIGPLKTMEQLNRFQERLIKVAVKSSLQPGEGSDKIGVDSAYKISVMLSSLVKNRNVEDMERRLEKLEEGRT